MWGKHFYFIVALFCYLVEDVWSYCYDSGFTFNGALGGDDINDSFDNFCKERSDRTYTKTDKIQQCTNISGDKNHLDIVITINELMIPSEDLYFSMDACKYILTKAKSDMDETGCFRGGQNIQISYLAPTKRNIRGPIIDEGNQSISHGHAKGVDEGISYGYYLEGDEETFGNNEEAGSEDTSDDHEGGDDQDAWNAAIQDENEHWPDEYIQGDISGHGSTTTVISLIQSSITSTIPALQNNATSFITSSNPGRKKHKTKTITETTTGTVKTTETMTTTASITNTVMTTGTTIQTITTFISTSSISTDSSGSTNVYFKGEVKIDPETSPC